MAAQTEAQPSGLRAPRLPLLTLKDPPRAGAPLGPRGQSSLPWVRGQGGRPGLQAGVSWWGTDAAWFQPGSRSALEAPAHTGATTPALLCKPPVLAGKETWGLGGGAAALGSFFPCALGW